MSFNSDQTYFVLHMQANDGLYSPELEAEQMTDRDVLVRDIVDGQFLGEFVALLQFERDAGGKLRMWDVSSEVTEAMEEEDDEYFAPEPIGVELAGIETIQRVL
jgi:hypothetical protein